MDTNTVHYSHSVRTPYDQGVHDASIGFMQDTNDSEYIRGYRFGRQASLSILHQSNQPPPACLL